MLKNHQTQSKSHAHETQYIKNLLYVGQKGRLAGPNCQKSLIRRPKLDTSRSKIFNNDYTEAKNYHLGIPPVKKRLYVEQNWTKLIKNDQTYAILSFFHFFIGGIFLCRVRKKRKKIWPYIYIYIYIFKHAGRDLMNPTSIE